MGTIAKRWCLRPGKRDGLENVVVWAQLEGTDRLEGLQN